MNVAGIKDTKIVRIPSWESKLWSYVGSSDGEHCPLYDNCTSRLEGNLCPCDYVGYAEELLATKQFDPADYDFIGNIKFDIFFKLIEKLANKYLKRGNVKQPPVPTELFSLADENHPIEVRLVPLSCCNGATWHLNNCWVIHLNANDPFVTRRFTLFHEAFHVITQCKCCYSFKRGLNDGHSFYEFLAERFAASILMPREWVMEKWLESNDLDRMAEIFVVPKPLMYIELKLLRLV